MGRFDPPARTDRIEAQNSSARLNFDLPCVILAGGKSSRFGTPKGLAPLQGMAVIQHVINRLASQCTGPVAINALDGHPYGAFGLEVIPDIFLGGIGPLAGIHAAMAWAALNGHEYVLTAPVDLPLLPMDLAAQLLEHSPPVVAASEGRLHGVCGIWPSSLEGTLADAIRSGERKVMRWIELCHATPCPFGLAAGIDPFLNINAADDLAKLEAHFDNAAFRPADDQSAS